MCFVPFSEQTAVIFLYKIQFMDFITVRPRKRIFKVNNKDNSNQLNSLLF
jgi:hypothetical protein